MSEVTRSLLQRWGASFRRGADFDSWGQLVEAIVEYQILARHYKRRSRTTENHRQNCNMRSTPLQSTQSQEEFKLEDLRKPVPLRKIFAPGEEENLEFEEDEEQGGGGFLVGTLLPRLLSEPEIGLEDARQCLNPYIILSVKELNGIDLTPVQDTPVTSRKEDTYVHFNVDIELQKHVEKLTKGAAIFFEFKHYRPKTRFTSTKCFAFMEMDEIKPGPIVMELYKKPTDFKRKKLQLLTKKPLYLHLHQTLHKE
uniref:Axin interactor, dorsalization-associated protein n=1 Tax=Jaculus jaculus TaxID=51337 RepID=A0A8C5KRH2_JACJA